MGQAINFDVETSTASDFTGTIVSTITTNANAVTLSYGPGTLAANTLYFVRVGALFSGTTTYSITSTTITFTAPLVGFQFYAVNISSITANWVPIVAGASGMNWTPRSPAILPVRSFHPLPPMCF